VEFAIPLSLADTTENGDKAISFTALSTITTAASGTSATRTYPTATNAVGGYADAAKPYPSTITVKAPGEGIVDNRYKYVLKEATTAITQDGTRDSAYNSGLHFKSYYSDGAAACFNTNNYFDLYMAADSSNIYVLYEIADNNIVSDATRFYQNDCADFCFNLTGEARYNKEIRVWGAFEGTDHYDDTNSDGTYVYGMNKGDSSPINDLKNVESYTVKKTTKGYNVEMTISREGMNGGDTFSFLGVATQAESATSRTYTYTENSLEKAGNDAKNFLNIVQIVPSTGKTELPEDEKPVDTYDDVIDYGKRWKYYLTESKTSLVLDGYRDDTYKNGLKFENTYLFNGPTSTHIDIDPNNTYELFMAADGDYIFFLYEFKDTDIITANATSYYNDGVQFCFDKDGAASGAAFAIYYSTGERFGTVSADGLTATYIVRNNPGVGYNVEFMIPRSGITNKDLFSFTGLSTIAHSLDDRSYGYIDNPLSTGANNQPKSVLTQVEIIKGYEPVETEYDELIDNGTRWKYYLEESRTSILLDGDKDVSYNDGLKFSHMYNRWNSLDQRNSYNIYLAADDDEVSILYEVTDPFIVIDGQAIYHNDCAQISFNKDGGARSATDGTSFAYKGGDRYGTAKIENTTVSYVIKRTDIGYNVEIVIPRSEINNGNLFSFIGIVTVAQSATTRDYGFMANPLNTAADDTPRALLTQIEIVDLHPGTTKCDISDMMQTSDPIPGSLGVGSISSSNSTSHIYTAYKTQGFTGVDANKEAAYDNAVHFHGVIDGKNEFSISTTYDAYVAYGSDGLVHVYCDIKDSDIVTNDLLWKTVDYRCDGMDIYVWYGTTSTSAKYGITPSDTSYSIYNRVGNNKIAPVSVAKRLTNDGWVFEATFKYNMTTSDGSGAATLAGGETMGIAFYYNDASAYKDPVNFNAGGYNKVTVTSRYKNYANAYMSPNGNGAYFNTIKFSNSTPTENVSAYSGIVSNPSNTVVVYPKYASTETKEDATTLASAIGATAYEEGNASIANATYVILAGHVTSYTETGLMIDKIGYGRYGVGVFGNTISIIGPTEEMMDKAIDTFLKVRNGSLDKKTLYYGTSTAVGGHSLPWLEYTTTVTDSGYGNYQLIKWNANQHHYNRYIEALLEAGYKIYTTNELGGKYQSTTFYNATDIVTLNYGLHYSSAIACTDTAKTSFPAMGNSIRVLVSSRAVYSLPENDVPEYTPTHETVFVQMGESHAVDTDLCDIIRLDNGEFIIFDSEHTNDIDYILAELLALSDGKKPVVAAWFFTHFHQDHIGGFVQLIKNSKVAEGITVKNVVFNFGSRQITDTASAGDDANLAVWLQGLEYTGANLVYGYTGQTFRFANATVEILNTFSDSMPYSMTDTQDATNTTNQLFSLRLTEAGTTQRFIITGDSSTEQLHIAHQRYGSYLKADFLQLPHHGWGDYQNYSGASGTVAYNSNLTFYNYVDPTFVLMPRSKEYGGSAAEKETADKAAAKTGGEFIQSYDAATATPKTIRLNIPYTKGDRYVYTSLPGGLEDPVFSNTATGNANDHNGVAKNPNDKVTTPYAVNENGSYVYITPTAYTSITTDGVMDPIYTYGVHLKGNKASRNDADVSYDVYLIAGQDGKIHFFYSVKDSVRVNKKTSEITAAFRQDGVDFWYDSQFRGNGTVNADVRIIAVNSNGAAGVATQKQYYVDSKIETGIFQDYAVVTNSTGYTVEFTIDKQFVNGDKFTFAALVNSINSWTSDSSYTNLTMATDTYAISMAGKYLLPNAADNVNCHNILVISSAPATEDYRDELLNSDDSANRYQSVFEHASKVVGVMNGNDATPQKIVGVNTVYTVPESDGVMDNIYTFGYRVESKYTEDPSWMEQYPHSFEAYIVYAQDGKFHVFIETKDTTPGCIDATNYWRRDGIDFYFNVAFTNSFSGSYHFDAKEGAQSAGTQPADYKVTKTAEGFNYEFSFDMNGKQFTPGDILEFGIYMNSANDKYYTESDGTKNTEKKNLTNGNVTSDAKAAYIAPSAQYYDGVQIMSLNSEVALALAACEHSYANTGLCTKCGAECPHDYDGVVTPPTCSKDGYTTYTCIDCGYSYKDEGESATGEHEYGADHTCECGATVGHEYGEDNICDHCGMETVIFEKSMQAFLSLESIVKLNVAYTFTGFDAATHTAEAFRERFGILIWYTDNISEEAATYANCENIIAGAEYDESRGKLTCQTNGIPAKNLGDTMSFRIYYRNDDGTYSYSRVITNYSPKKYCYNQIKNYPDEIENRNLMVAILNYGAAAQIYFNHNVENLMNADLSAADRAFTWDGSLVRSSYDLSAEKVADFARSSEVTSRGGNLSLEGAIDYNFYSAISVEVVSAKIYYWTETKANSVSKLTLENATSSEDLEWDASDERWEAKYEG